MVSEIASDEQLRSALSEIEARQLERTRRRNSIEPACKDAFRLWDELTDKAASALKLAMANKKSLDNCLAEKHAARCQFYRDDFHAWYSRYLEYREQGDRAYEAWVQCEGAGLQQAKTFFR